MKKESTRLASTARGFVYATLTAFVLCANAAPLAAGQQPDNSKVNTRDRQKAAATADKQSNDPADLDLTKRIRQALTADKSLSTYARNVKVITAGGKVTLKGPVRTAEEKKAVETKAAEIAGADHVVSQLSVAAKASTPKK